MKIYHTETQEDYDALMVELKERGIETLPKERWKNYKCETAVFVHAIDKNHSSSRIDTTYSDVAWAIYKYPEAPITKYKAKAETPVKFTKENVYKLAERYRSDFDYLIDDLKSDIFKLDDTPEKVVVPKYIADYLEERKRDGDGLVTSLYPYQGNSGEAIEDWFEEEENNVSFARAWLDGYTIEPEKLYYIPLPHLETTDGLQQVLSKRKNDTHYFASRPNDKLKQRYTKDELEQVPEAYKPYATPIEGEEE